ncbi:MAG: cytochrome c [Thermoanaerobaculia bacterium]|nr:cytochrome c [Thermoanaerobaculia bacterium]
MNRMIALVAFSLAVTLSIGCGGETEENPEATEQAEIGTSPAPEPESEASDVPLPAPETPLIDEDEPDTVADGSTAGVERGTGIFASKCSSCHGSRGKGDTAIGRKNEIRDLGSGPVQAMSDAELADVIRNGTGPLSSKMHPSKDLSEEQLRDVITFIRSL